MSNPYLNLPPSMGGSGKGISSSTPPGQSSALSRLDRTKLPSAPKSGSRLAAKIAAPRLRALGKNFLP